MTSDDDRRDSAGALTAAVPQGLIHKGPIARHAIEGGRRQATVLFVDMAGFTPLAERLGEEKTYLLMQRVIRAMTQAVHAHEGTVQDLLGDGLMALFGVPIANENAPLEACRAACDLRGRMIGLEAELERDFGVRPKFRIGVHTGPIVVGEVGDDLRVEVKSFGDTVNFASRLQTEAEPGSILISAATNELVSDFFETRLIGERPIKGKSELQRLFELDEAKGETTRFDVALRRGLTPLLGRGHELGVLKQNWEEAGQGHFRIVTIEGDAGIGKSRLVFEFRQGLRDDASVLGRCTPSGQAIPFKPIISIARTISCAGAPDPGPGPGLQDIVRRGLAALELNTDETFPYLMYLFGQDSEDSFVHRLPPEVAGIHARRALSALLRARCRKSPLALVVEDIHWIDTASEDWLMRLSEDARDLPLLIITSFRPGYQSPLARVPGVVTIKLAPLSDETTVEFFKSRIGISDLPAKLARLAVTKTQGNPLFAEEIANYLLDRGEIRREGAQIFYEPAADAATIPVTLENLLLERFDHLDDKSRLVLEIASVIGPSFSDDLVSEVSGLNGSAVPHLMTLEDKELVFREADGRYHFKHALVQDAIYNRLLTQTRRNLHENIADAIERRLNADASEVVNSLADHYSKTARADKAVHYMALAGAKSLQVYALEEAERRFRAILDLIESVPGCAPDAVLADVVIKMARLHYYKAEFRNTIMLVERYLPRIAKLGDKRLQSRLFFELGYACVFGAQAAAGRKFLEHAMSLGEEIDDAETIAYAGLGLMYCHVFWGSYSDEERVVLRALTEKVSELSLTLPDAWVAAKCLNCRWSEALFLGNFAEARELCTELLELGQARDDPRPAAFAYWQRGLTNLLSDEYGEAITDARQSLGIALAPLDRMFARYVEGSTLSLSGHAAEGFAMLDEIRRRSDASGFMFLIMLIDVFYGASMSLRGELGGGVRFIHDSIRRISAWGNPWFPMAGYMVLGEIYLQMATSREKPPMAVILHNLGFVLTNVPFAASKARRYLDEAIRRCREIAMPGYLARCLYNIGMVHRARNRIAKARACFSEALTVANSIGAYNLAAKARTALDAL